MTLSIASERCAAARKMVAEGESSALYKQRDQRKQLIDHSFGALVRSFARCVQHETALRMKNIVFWGDIFPQLKTIFLYAISARELNAKQNNQTQHRRLYAKQSYCPRPYAEDFFETGAHTHGRNSNDQAPTRSSG